MDTKQTAATIEERDIVRFCHTGSEHQVSYVNSYGYILCGMPGRVVQPDELTLVRKAEPVAVNEFAGMTRQQVSGRMKMSLADIGAQITNDAFNQVTRETFGNLAPVHRRVYQGEVLFANADIAGEGQPIIRTDFPGLDSSPWLYDALTEYFQRVAIRKLKPGTVAKWTGTYMLFKNGNSRFSGKVSVLNV